MVGYTEMCKNKKEYFDLHRAVHVYLFYFVAIYRYRRKIADE